MDNQLQLPLGEQPLPQYETLATAFVLLHGHPPKSLRYRNHLFCVTDAKAGLYRANADVFVIEQLPSLANTYRNTRIQRNCLLRAVYKQLGIESR